MKQTKTRANPINARASFIIFQMIDDLTRRSNVHQTRGENVSVFIFYLHNVRRHSKSCKRFCYECLSFHIVASSDYCDATAASQHFYFKPHPPHFTGLFNPRNLLFFLCFPSFILSCLSFFVCHFDPF